MKRKLLNLLMMLTLGVSGAWADELRAVVFSLTDPTAPTENLASQASSELTATISGGTALVYNGKSSAAQLVTNSQVNLGGSGASYLKLTLDNALAEGDVITLKDYSGNNITTDEAFYVSTSTTKGSTKYTFPYEVTSSSALKGKKEIYFWKSAVGTIRTINIESSHIPVKMTYVDYNTPDASYGEIAVGQTAKSGYNKISGGSVGFGNTSWNCNWITYLKVDASAVEGNITKVQLNFDASGSTDSKRAVSVGAGYNTSVWSSTMTYNTANRSITTLGSVVSGSSASATSYNNLSIDITNAFLNDDDKIATILLYETAAAGCYIKNPTVVVTYTTATPADYTIQYQDAEGNTLKESVTYTNGVIVGQPFTASAADMASFWANSKKYKYVSGNTNTNAQETNNVITLVFEEAPKYTITLNATGALTQELATAQVYEGENATIYFKKYIKNGSSWTYCDNVYSKGVQDNYYGWNFKNVMANASKDITYKVADIDDAYEVEDMDLVGNEGSAIGAGSRMSNSKGRRLSAGAYVTTDALPAGIYTIDLAARADAGGSNSKSTISYGIVDNGSLIPSGAYFPTIDYGVTSTVTITDVVIYEGQKFALYNNGGSVSNLASDYITLKRTGNVASATMSCKSKKLGTFVAPFDVTLPEGINAYSATATATNLVLTKVAAGTQTQDIPQTLAANTPVILYNEGTEDLATTTFYGAEVAHEATKTVGAITGLYTAGTVPADSYVLQTQSGVQAFYKVASPLTGVANRCYVTAGASGAKALIPVFGEDVTAVKDVEAAKAIVKAIKYVKNGKLVIETSNGIINAAGAYIK